MSVRYATLGLLALAAACGSEPSAEAATEPTSTPVRTTPATVTTRPDPIRTSGTLASRAEVDLAFKVPGYVAEILVEEGDAVRADQVLARLRSEEVDAQVRSAQAQADLASRNLERLESLFADSVVSEAMLDEARDGHERAQAGLDVARFNQTYATIRSPSDGRVLRRMIEVSEFAAPGVAVFRLGSTASGWIVRVSVADRDVVRLAAGDPAQVELPALGSGPLVGRVSEIADAADPRTGTFEIEIAVDGAPPGLRSGMVATVNITPGRDQAMSFLPTRSLIDADGLDAAVFVLVGDRVRLQAVRIARIGPESVGVVGEGLEGALVVTDGAAYLRDGDRVDDRTSDFPETGN